MFNVQGYGVRAKVFEGAYRDASIAPIEGVRAYCKKTCNYL